MRHMLEASRCCGSDEIRIRKTGNGLNITWLASAGLFIDSNSSLAHAGLFIALVSDEAGRKWPDGQPIGRMPGDSHEIENH
uniref:Uncharacterized protein n=1 Tax=Pseudomonas marincola TaxID=437900 RepID=A0A653E6R9_9PSED